MKPDLNFFFSALQGLNGMYMRNDYESATNNKELTEVAYKWLNEAETTTNDVRKQNYTSGYHYLFSYLTGHSFDSKINLENFAL